MCGRACSVRGPIIKAAWSFSFKVSALHAPAPTTPSRTTTGPRGKFRLDGTMRVHPAATHTDTGTHRHFHLSNFVFVLAPALEFIQDQVRLQASARPDGPPLRVPPTLLCPILVEDGDGEVNRDSSARDPTGVCAQVESVGRHGKTVERCSGSGGGSTHPHATHTAPSKQRVGPHRD